MAFPKFAFNLKWLSFCCVINNCFLRTWSCGLNLAAGSFVDSTNRVFCEWDGFHGNSRFRRCHLCIRLSCYSALRSSDTDRSCIGTDLRRSARRRLHTFNQTARLKIRKKEMEGTQLPAVSLRGRAESTEEKCAEVWVVVNKKRMRVKGKNWLQINLFADRTMSTSQQQRRQTCGMEHDVSSLKSKWAGRCMARLQLLANWSSANRTRRLISQ